LQPERNSKSRRGCVFFNFGHAYTLRLLVALYSLRRVYDGPVTTFLSPDSDHPQLRSDLAKLDSDIVITTDLSKSWHRHRQFRASPYEATLLCDSDLIFQAPIDALWEPLERDGLLVTRFFSPPYGVDGTSEQPGFANRMAHLDDIRSLIGEDYHDEAKRQLLNERIDVNIGVMGIARPAGNAFLDDWADFMERGGSRRILLMDEMLVVALMNRHRHYLADETWNCPADEFFRQTNLADASIIHYFADGHTIHGIRLGRNPSTWAGRKWFDMYLQAADRLELDRWTRFDPNFTGGWRRVISERLSNGRFRNPKTSMRNKRKRHRESRLDTAGATAGKDMISDRRPEN